MKIARAVFALGLLVASLLGLGHTSEAQSVNATLMKMGIGVGPSPGVEPGYPNFPISYLATLHTLSGVTVAGAPLSSMADTTMSDSPYGATALQFTYSGSAGSSGYIGPAAVLATPVDVRNGNIYFTFKGVANMSAISTYDVNLALYSAGTPAAPSANATFYNSRAIINAANANRWQTIAVNTNIFSVAGTGADLSAIKYALVSIKRNSGLNITLAIGDVFYRANPRTKATVIFGFDDAYVGPYTYAKDILAARGKGAMLYPGAIYSGAGIDGTGKLTLAQVQELSALGWQIACQAAQDENSKANTAAYLADFQQARLYDYTHGLRARDGTAGSWYSNVNDSDASALAAAKQVHRDMRIFKNMDPTAAPLVGNGEVFPFGDQWQWRGSNAQTYTGSGNEANTVTYITAALDQVVATKGVFHPIFHAGLDNTANDRLVFDTIIAYVDAHPTTIEILTEDQLLSPYLAQYGPAPASAPLSRGNGPTARRSNGARTRRGTGRVMPQRHPARLAA